MKNLDPKKRVNVYFNLHTHVWSVRQSGRIIDHTEFICLKDVRFLVGKAGQKKVRIEKRKNVHACASGYVISFGDALPEKMPEDLAMVTYNPYENDTFVRIDNKEPVLSSDTVIMGVKDGKTNVEAIWF